MPYDVNIDDTHEFTAVVPPAGPGKRRFASVLTARKRYLATGVATLGLAAVIGIAAGGTGAAHPANPSTDPLAGTVAAAGDGLGPAPKAGVAAPPAVPSPSVSPAPASSKPSAAKPTPATKPTPAGSPKAKAPARPGTRSAGWVAPMSDYRMNSCHGPRRGGSHQGIDFAVSKGAPIYAAAAGTVVSAGRNAGGYGNMIIIKHSARLFTLYGHASKVLVHAGQKVKAGQEIMLEGGTGHVTGPHLHFEVWNAMWHRINPVPFLRAHGVPLPRC